MSIVSRILIRKVADFVIYESKLKNPNVLWLELTLLNQTFLISGELAHDEREEAVTRDTFPLLLQFLGYSFVESITLEPGKV